MPDRRDTQPEDGHRTPLISGVGFDAVQRRLGLYLRALWGRGFTLAPAARVLPAIESGTIALPVSWPDVLHYRAAATHAAAHLMYGSVPFVANDLKGRQRALIALLEDARVESLALRDFPGVRQLWLPFHCATAAEGIGFDALLARLARACIDPGYHDPDAWVRKGVALYRAQVHECPDMRAAHAAGMWLANDIGQLRIPMNESQPPCVVAYRDDNRHLWVQEQALAAAGGDAVPTDAARRSVHLIEQAGGKALPFAAERPAANAPAGWSIRPADADAALEFSASDDGASLARHRYPEWDYRIAVLRQDWVTVHERDVPAGAAGSADTLLSRHAPLLAALERVVHALRLQGRRRLRRQYEGEDVDLDAAVGAAVELRSRYAPELRVYERQHLHSRQDVTLLLLLDLSESMNDRLADAQGSVLETTRAASLLLAVVLDRLGERFAVHGFNSDGRHAVGYARFKDFAAICDAPARERIAGIHAGLSTRLGAALRHAGAALASQPGERKLLLVITDGQPSDVDVHDARYLTEDARQAVQVLRSGGVQSFCLSLDPRGDAYAARIFGPAHYEVLDRIERLPEKLPRLVLSLTRRP